MLTVADFNGKPPVRSAVELSFKNFSLFENWLANVVTQRKNHATCVCIIIAIQRETGKAFTSYYWRHLCKNIWYD